MASNVINPMQSEQCLRHGHFMNNLNASSVKAIFWALFLIVLVALTVATSAFTKSTHIATHIRNAEIHPTISREVCPTLLSKSKAVHRRTQMQCIYVCFLCLSVAVVCTVFEAFAASTLMFCHKLDMAFLYWSFWTLLQVGSTIAIFGIAVAQLWSLTGREALPVNVAIGTPVLLIAWLGVAFEYLFKGWLSEEAIRSFDSFVNSLMDSSSETVPENQTSTPASPTAELVGFTIDGCPIISFNRLSDALHPMARYLGTTEDGRPLYTYMAGPTNSADSNTKLDANTDAEVGNTFVAELAASRSDGESGRPGGPSRTITFQEEIAIASPSASTAVGSQDSGTDDFNIG